MRIAVCEDEQIFRENIIKEIEGYYHSLDVVVDGFSSGEELIEKYENGRKTGSLPHYDLLFLDIEMKVMDGFETARRIRSYGGREILLFLTSHTEMAMEGYEVNAFRFLGKPLKKEKLTEALQQVQQCFLQEKTILLRGEEEEVVVPLSSILYAEAMKNYVYYYIAEHTSVGSVKLIKVREKIAEVEQKLKEDGFFRCHRSYVISLMQVVSFDKKEVVLKNGTSLPISRGKAEELKQKLIRIMNKGE